MKTLLALATVILTTAVSAQAEWVRGHFRSNGTYVNSYYRTPTNGTPYDNLSYRGYDEAVRPFLTALRSQRDYLVGQAARANDGDGLRLAGKPFYRIGLFHSLWALSLSNATTSVPMNGAEQLALCKALLEEVQTIQASLETDSRTSSRELREKLGAIQNQMDRLPDTKLDPTQRDARRRHLQTAKTQIEEALAEGTAIVFMGRT